MTDLDHDLRTLADIADLGLDPELQTRIERRVAERTYPETDRAPVRRQRGSRAPRLSLAVLAGAAAIAVATTILTLTNSGSTPPPDRVAGDAITRASAAISPSAGIAHLTIVSVDATTPYPYRRIESWSATGPARWRTRAYPRPNPHSGVLRNGKIVSLKRPEELSYGDGKLTTYYLDFNEATVLTGVSADSPSAKNHALTGLRGNDPIGVLRRKLEAGDFRDAGLVNADGRQVRRLVAASAHGSRRYRTVYDVDPRTFAPVAVDDTLSSVDRKGKRHTSTTRLRLTYQALADTAGNARLLRITIPQDAKVTRRRAILPHYRKHR